MSFTPRRLFSHIQDEAALGAALLVLNEAIDREVVRRTINNPGDYCPLAYVFIDGMPTDDWINSAKLLLGRQDRKIGVLAFIGMGSQVSVAQLTAKVPGIIGYNLNEMSPDFTMSFFKWIDQETI